MSGEALGPTARQGLMVDGVPPICLPLISVSGSL